MWAASFEYALGTLGPWGREIVRQLTKRQFMVLGRDSASG